MQNRSNEDETKRQEESASSPGNNSRSVTPKDVSPEDATAKDMKERKIASDDPQEKEEDLLDDAVEMSFPASDPIAIPASSRPADKRKAGGKRT